MSILEKFANMIPKDPDGIWGVVHKIKQRPGELDADYYRRLAAATKQYYAPEEVESEEQPEK